MRTLSLESLESRLAPATLDLTGYVSPVNVTVASYSVQPGFFVVLSGGTTGFAFGVTDVLGNGGTLTGRGAASAWALDSVLSYSTAGHSMTFSSMASLKGGAAADTFTIGLSCPSMPVNGGGGDDTLDLSGLGAATISITGNNAGTSALPQIPSFVAIRNITTGTGDDVFIFSDGVGVSGALDGGGGDNWLDYSDYTIPVVATLVDSGVGSATNVGGNIKNFGNVIGGAANDVLTGNSGSNVLVGSGGDDRLIGGGGDDVLIGGAGADTMDGGSDGDMLLSEAFVSTDYTGVKAIWTGAGSLDGRANAIISTYGSFASDDGAADRMSGSGGSNWFWMGTGDTVTDFTVGVDRLDMV